MKARALLGGLSVALASSCAVSPEPSSELPPTVATEAEAFAGAPQGLESAAAADGRWWERFEDPATDALVERALANNLDLRAAGARVLEAEARLGAARGARGPALDVSGRAARNFNQRFFISRADIEDWDVNATLSWQADLFGRLRAAQRAQGAAWKAGVFDHEALAHSLVAQVVRGRVALSVGLQRLDVARGVVRSRARTLATVEARYARGVQGSSAVDVRLARENLAAAEAAIPALELALSRAGFALDVVLGARPGTSVADRSLALALPTAPAPPPGVPAALLDRRPDLRAAAYRFTASEAEVDVAVASLWPDLVLSATGGFSALGAGNLLTSDSLYEQIAANLSARLFASGQLRAEVRAAEARFAAQTAEYAASVLNAVREVEDALAAERRLREQLAFVRTQRDEAVRAEQLARDRYGRGLESLLVVLETERRQIAATDSFLRLSESVWNARIDLHLALGGDWELPGAPDEEGARAHEESNP